MLLHFLV